MSDLNALVSANIGLLAIALVSANIGLLVAIVLTTRRAAAVERRLASMTRGADGRDLGAVLEAHLDKVYAVARRQEQLDRHAGALDAQARRSIQGVGLIRFNNFEDMGGNQSFAIALVDPDGTGIVLSSLHARNQTRIYAKGINAGATDGALSDEEAEAVRVAAARAQGR